MDLNRTFVTSDHHFRYWKHPLHLHCESTEEEEREHIALWNSIVGKDDLVFYVGDFCDGADHELQEIRSQLNGRMILIKGNHDKNSDEAYRQALGMSHVFHGGHRMNAHVVVHTLVPYIRSLNLF